MAGRVEPPKTIKRPGAPLGGQLPSTRINRAFYRYTFELRDNGKIVYSHTMLINPSEMSMDEPPRVNVVQTLGGAYVKLYGQGLPSVTISGTTGFSARRKSNNSVEDGYTEWLKFRDKVYRYYVKAKSSKVEMYWYNWEDDEYYKVVPMAFRLQRNKAEPLMYRYELRFTCIYRLTSVSSLSKSAVGRMSTLSATKALSMMDLNKLASLASEIKEAFNSKR